MCGQPSKLRGQGAVECCQELAMACMGEEQFEELSELRSEEHLLCTISAAQRLIS